MGKIHDVQGRVVNEARRKAYFALFKEGRIDKQYEAVASLPQNPEQRTWLIESRIERNDVWIVFRNVAGEINARSRIELLELAGDRARFLLSPLTGKTHQLRLHMGLIGAQIQGARFYPALQPRAEVAGYSHPLQLLAKRLVFTGPLSGIKHLFESENRLTAWRQ